MSNRHERRAAKARGMLGAVVRVNIGRCLMNGETKLKCFTCSNEAKDWAWPDGPALLGYGIAIIEASNSDQVAQVPLCESCYNSDDVSNVITRKVLKAPDLEISEGGEATLEHVLEIAAAESERPNATEH
jgi:hypothetical protein